MENTDKHKVEINKSNNNTVALIVTAILVFSAMMWAWEDKNSNFNKAGRNIFNVSREEMWNMSSLNNLLNHSKPMIDSPFVNYTSNQKKD